MIESHLVFLDITAVIIMSIFHIVQNQCIVDCSLCPLRFWYLDLPCCSDINNQNKLTWLYIHIHVCVSAQGLTFHISRGVPESTHLPTQFLGQLIISAGGTVQSAQEKHLSVQKT